MVSRWACVLSGNIATAMMTATPTLATVLLAFILYLLNHNSSTAASPRLAALALIAVSGEDRAFVPGDCHFDAMAAGRAVGRFDEDRVVARERAGQARHRLGWEQMRADEEAAGFARHELQAGFERVIVGVGDV